MPVTIPAGTGIASWHFKYDNDSEDMICTLGVQAVAPPLTQAHAQRCLTAWVEHLLTHQLLTVTLLKCVLRVRGEGGGDSVFEAVPAATETGDTTGSGLPSNTALVVKKLTGLAGRRGVGRMFVPGINDTQVDNAGNVATANVNAWNTSLAAFLANLTGPGDGTPAELPVNPVLLHASETTTTRSKSGGVTTITVTEGAAGPLPTLITGFVLDTKAGTQRRRMR